MNFGSQYGSPSSPGSDGGDSSVFGLTSTGGGGGGAAPNQRIDLMVLEVVAQEVVLR